MMSRRGSASRAQRTCVQRRDARGVQARKHRGSTQQHQARRWGAGAGAHRLHVGRDAQEPELTAPLADALRIHHLAQARTHTVGGRAHTHLTLETERAAHA